MHIFNSVISDLACEWFGRFVVFSSGGSPISSTYKFLSSEWGKFQLWSVEFGRTLSGEIQATELGLQVEEIPTMECEI